MSPPRMAGLASLFVVFPAAISIWRFSPFIPKPVFRYIDATVNVWPSGISTLAIINLDSNCFGVSSLISPHPCLARIATPAAAFFPDLPMWARPNSACHPWPFAHWLASAICRSVINLCSCTKMICALFPKISFLAELHVVVFIVTTSSWNSSSLSLSFPRPRERFAIACLTDMSSSPLVLSFLTLSLK